MTVLTDVALGIVEVGEAPREVEAKAASRMLEDLAAFEVATRRRTGGAVGVFWSADDAGGGRVDFLAFLRGGE